MNPEVEKLISQVIGEVQRKSLFEAKLDAIEEGRKEGRKVGRKEGKEEVAKNLRGVIADEEISRISNLSLERVKQL